METPEYIEGIPTEKKKSPIRRSLIEHYYELLRKELQRENGTNGIFNTFLGVTVIIKKGESDKKMAAHYYDNLKAVVAYVRDYLVRKTGDEKYANLPLICGTYSLKSRDRSEVIVNALHRLSAEDSNFHVVDIEDATIQRERLHFDRKGAELLGQRVYKRLMEVTGGIK
jgi:hypothetical protein